MRIKYLIRLIIAAGTAVTSAVLFVLLFSTSCKQKTSDTQDNQSQISVVDASLNSNEDSNFILESLKITGKPYKLCDQKLTSDGYFEKLQAPEGFEPRMSYEPTPVSDAFFYPEPDIKVTDMVKNMQNRFNYVTVGNIVYHAEQLYYRKYTDEFGECRNGENRKEKYRLIAEDMPKISSNTLNNAFPSKKVLDKAQDLLRAYSKYNGDDDDPLWNLFTEYKVTFVDLPGAVVYDYKKDSAAFDKWYDKDQFITGFDKLVGLRSLESGISEDAIQHLVSAVECEKNIDRRTLLAMELLCHDREMGILKLGEIFESGLYSRYLYEAWDMWRTSVQIYHFGASSLSMIPDNYYGQIKAKCVNSIIRHIQKTPKEDHKFDLLVAEFLITTSSLERMGGLYGNEAIASME